MENKNPDRNELQSPVNGYWRVIEVNLDWNNENAEKELYETREEAEAICKEKQDEWEKRAWDYREYESLEYQVRFISLEELAEEERQKLEHWHSYLRTSYLDPIEASTFSGYCQTIISNMLQKLNKLSSSDIQRLRDEEISLYCPWQAYSAFAKIWAYMQLGPESQEVSFWGMFVQNSLFGTISTRIEKFANIDDFKSWLANSSQAATVFEERLMDALQSSINGEEYPGKNRLTR